MTAEAGVTPAPGPGLAGSVAQGNINPDTSTAPTKCTINILRLFLTRKWLFTTTMLVGSC